VYVWFDLGVWVVLCSRLHQAFSFFKGSKLRMGQDVVLSGSEEEESTTATPGPGLLPLYPSPCASRHARKRPQFALKRPHPQILRPLCP
jgi:hypothetical protein